MQRNARGSYGDKMLEDTFEALLSAVYLDQGIAVATKFIMMLIDKHVPKKDLSKEDNYKDILQRFLQLNAESLPSYDTVKEEGPYHKLLFTVCCTIRLEAHTFWAEGSGSSKKAAQQQAARGVFLRLKESDETTYRQELKKIADRDLIEDLFAD